LSLENYVIPGRRHLAHGGRQHGGGRARARPDGPAWSKTLACAEAPCTGTGRPREPARLAVQPGPHREGEEP
jgi:hypothetical protein